MDNLKQIIKQKLMEAENYYVISLKHGDFDKLCFWRSNNAGYTEYLDEAGVYSKEDIMSKPTYYNDGVDTIAIKVDEIQSFKLHTICMYNHELTQKLKGMAKRALKKTVEA